MKKLLAILFLIMTVQGIAETVVRGTYETKKKRYVELTETFQKEIGLDVESGLFLCHIVYALFQGKMIGDIPSDALKVMMK